MAEPTALRLHDNQSFPDQLGYAVHQMAVQTMAHLKKDTVLKKRDEGCLLLSSQFKLTHALFPHHFRSHGSSGSNA
eukprot:scaffold290545_cov47-Attheya_sp.AAC.1